MGGTDRTPVRGRAAYLSGKPVPADLFEELFVHQRPQPLFMAGR